MKRLLIATTALTLLAAPLSGAFAQGWNDRHDDHRPNAMMVRHDKDRFDRHANGRHRGWEKHAYRRGERLPDRYYTHTYYVTDYERYHLRRPERGYRYVRDDEGQIFLTAVATGLIVDIVVNGH